MGTPEQDEKALRDYMETTSGGLRPDRSTASYALEFIKTARHNMQHYAAKADLTQAVQQLEMAKGWAERAFNELLRLEKEKLR